MSLRSLMGLADQLGFSSRPLRVELSALAKVQAPAILHWDLNHFVVLRSVTPSGAVIHDPAIGVRTLPLAGAVEALHRRGARAHARRRTSAPVHAQAPIRLSSLWSQMTGFAERARPGDRAVGRAADRGLRRAVPDPARRRRSGLPRRPGSPARCSRSRSARWSSSRRRSKRLRGWALQGVRPSPELPDRRQSGPPHDAPAGRVLREASRRRHLLAHRRGAADPGGHHPRGGLRASSTA